MNLVEFMFAIIAVFGSTGAIFLWTSFTYSLEQNSKEEDKEEAIRIAK